MKDFEGNECEWPLFYTFLIIDGVFKSNTEQIEEYQAELRKCMYADVNGGNEHLLIFQMIFEITLIFFNYSRSSNFNVLCTRWWRWLHQSPGWATLFVGTSCIYHCAIADIRIVAHKWIGHDSAIFAELQSTAQRWTIFSFSGNFKVHFGIRWFALMIMMKMKTNAFSVAQMYELHLIWAKQLKFIRKHKRIFLSRVSCLVTKTLKENIQIFHACYIKYNLNCQIFHAAGKTGSSRKFRVPTIYDERK